MISSRWTWVALIVGCVSCSSSDATDKSKSSSSKADSAKSATASNRPTDLLSSAGFPTTLPTALPTSIQIGPPGDSGTTITYDPDGPNKIDESKLKGDAKACAMVKSCCQNQKGALALGCQLAIAKEAGDCAKIVETVKPMAAELGEPPPGCK